MCHFYSAEHHFCSHRIDVTAFVGSKCCEEEKDRQRFVTVIRGQIERVFVAYRGLPTAGRRGRVGNGVGHLDHV